MTHLMIDLETLATTPDAAVTQIGACTFAMRRDNYPGMIGAKFQAFLRPSEAGYIDYDTVMWWMKQSEDARYAAVTGAATALPERAAINKFLGWYNEQFDGTAGPRGVWSHGASFDIPIIERIIRYHGLEVPWRHYMIRDTRTLFDYACLDPKNIRREGTYHKAVDDARHQARCVIIADHFVSRCPKLPGDTAKAKEEASG